MPVPYMANTLNGWTRKTTVKVITQSVVDFETVETESSQILDINFQPMPPAQVNRKTEEERTWSWWSIIIKRGPLLKTNDRIVRPTGQIFKIEKANDWSESGFTKYEAIEDYEEST